MRGGGEHRVFGVRHHGPGSARALLAALDAFAPDAVLVEGPPEADALLALVADAELVPPVALLVYAKEAPGHAVFYPFTAFSPEWQALRWAAARAVPVRFMDLPIAHQLTAPAAAADGADGDVEEGEAQGELGLAFDEAPAPAAGGSARPHPFLQVALALGDDDPERWWEELVERRRDPTALFEALAALMTELRAARVADGGDAPAEALREARREAYMRRTIRESLRLGHQRVAVVCGAWHVPALGDLGQAAADAQRLRGLPKAKVAATWIPWTAARLAARSGYGAGVASPGWYAHVWAHPEDAAARWVAAAARLLRGEDDAGAAARAVDGGARRLESQRGAAAGLDTSSAAVIDAVRLADALAALRGRPSPGLAELGEAIRATLCAGDDAPMALVRDALEVGRAVGRVPESTPTVPLAVDLARERRRLRLRVSPDPEAIEVDLRTPNGRGRSVLLRRLEVLDVAWGTPVDAGDVRGSFRERWLLAWRPEHEVEIIAANVWGNTLRAAAAARLLARSREARTLVAVAELLDVALLAELDGAVTALLGRVEDEAARAADVAHLLGAVPALARVARYGDVRGTPPARVARILRGLFTRALLGLPAACVGVDDEAAAAIAEQIAAFHGAVPLVAAVAAAEGAVGAGAGAGEGAGAAPVSPPPAAFGAGGPFGPRNGSYRLRPSALQRVRRPTPSSTSRVSGLRAAAPRFRSGERLAAAGSEATPALDGDDPSAAWGAVLGRLSVDGAVHGLVRGLAARLLLEGGALDAAGLEHLARLALSRALPPRAASAWLEGLLRGSALVVLHQEGLWRALDAWLAGLAGDAFEEQLPLVRRAFAAFTPAERRRMGEQLARGGASMVQRTTRQPDALNVENAEKVVEALRCIMGTFGAVPGADPEAGDAA